MSLESVMPSKHLILCCPLLLLNLSQHQSLFNEHSGLISFRIDWFDLLGIQRTLNSALQHHSSEISTFWCSVFFIVLLTHPYMITGKNMVLTRSWKKQESSRKTSISVLLTMPKPLIVWNAINCGKFCKR